MHYTVYQIIIHRVQRQKMKKALILIRVYLKSRKFSLLLQTQPDYALKSLGQHRTIPALRLKHRSGGCGTASALPKCSIMSGCGTRIVLRGQKPLALCDRCPCFGSLFPPLAALTFAASSIICAFGLAAAAPRSPYRHLELCGIAYYLRIGERQSK